MKSVSIRDAKNRLTELAREVEDGETVVITRNGKPVADLVPHRRRGGINWAAIEEYKRKHKIKKFVIDIPADFDDPLPEDFLIRPLPYPKK